MLYIIITNSCSAAKLCSNPQIFIFNSSEENSRSFNKELEEHIQYMSYVRQCEIRLF